MAVKQRVSLPFGRPSPPYREEDALREFTSWIREEDTRKYETGWALRVRDCSGRARNVQLLDGNGGADYGLANACDEDSSATTGGFAEIWWAQRSGGRTVALEWDRGSLPSQVSSSAYTFPANACARVAGRVVDSAGLGLAGVTVTVVTDGGDTVVATTNAEGYYRTACVTPDGATVTPTLAGYGFTPTDATTTVSLTDGEAVDFVAAPAGITMVAVGSGTYKVARSTDGGETWAGVTDAAIPGTTYCVAYGDGTFVVGGKTTNQLAYSTDDGATWTGCGTPFGTSASSRVYDLAWTGTVFVAAGYNYNAGYLGLAVSSDGQTWAAVADTAKEGIPDGCAFERIAVSGGTIYATGLGGWGNFIAVSDDDGASWQGNLMQTAADAENDPAWFDAYIASTGTYTPIASNGTDVVSCGATPRHSVITYGSAFVDGVPPEDWSFEYGVGQTRLLVASGQFIGTAGWINDGVHTTGATVHKYAGVNSNGIVDLLWDGTQFIALGTDWDADSISWIGVSPTGASWTSYFTSEETAPGGFSEFYRIRKIDGRYWLCGYVSGGAVPMPIAYATTINGSWSTATAGETVMSEVWDIAGAEE